MLSKIANLKSLLCFNFYQGSLLINRLYKAELKPLGITYLQYVILGLLHNSNNLKITNLCQQLGVDTGTISPVVKSLFKKELIERQKNTADARETIISLSYQGLQLTPKLIKIQLNIANTLETAYLTNLPADIKQLIKSLEKYALFTL